MRSLFARLAQRHNPVSPEQRREFLKQSLAVGAGLLVGGLGAAPARARTDSRRVVVVGAGLAGLACAHEVRALGFAVTVVEASPRVGGRVLSLSKRFGGEIVEGGNVEAGGELIGSNHPLWIAYAKKFGLSFLDVTEDEDADFAIELGGRVIRGDESLRLYEAVDRAFAGLNEQARAINPDAPWDAPDANALDARTIADWIASLDVDEPTRRAIAAQLQGDNGVANERASFLGMLTAIAGGGVESYWTQTEVYRCAGGNQQLAAAFAERLGATPGANVMLGKPVRAIDVGGPTARVTVGGDTSGAGSSTLECDHVVLAVAPSVWRKIAITPGLGSALLPEALHAGGVQMGTTVKHLSVVRDRFWKREGLDPTALMDGVVSWTWDATDGQKTREACLTAFVGGPSADRVRALGADRRRELFAERLERVFRGYREALVEARFVDWPSFAHVGGGYSFPAPGQVTGVGPLVVAPMGPHKNLHLAGEHACLKFVGYMEGALQSGVRVARGIGG
jgi:monoamine oxidase